MFNPIMKVLCCGGVHFFIPLNNKMSSKITSIYGLYSRKNVSELGMGVRQDKPNNSK